VVLARANALPNLLELIFRASLEVQPRTIDKGFAVPAATGEYQIRRSRSCSRS
jgi:hypothetical protein